MPVYNTSAYLGEAIQSILTQTFSDFELIIIDDGSTDQSENILLSFKDSRIRHIKNEENSGLIYTLNKGIDLASASWIARMDGDDIALPERIQEQWLYIESHPETKVLATRVKLITENGTDYGIWKEDEDIVASKDIRSFLPKNNCLAHPTIMIRTELIKKYRYDQRQLHTEDYDLWLRLEADGIDIHKVDKPLLQHRIHRSSVTRKDQKNVFYKLAGTKTRFATNAIKNGKLNAFVFKTLMFSMLDWSKGFIKSIIS